MNPALEFVGRMGPQRIAAMGAVTLALVVFFAFVMMRVTQPTMGVLYSDLSLQDSSAIIRDLESRGVPFEMRGDGATILAPRGDLARLRMDLAGKGIPVGGGVGYEIFDRGDSFSATSFVQNINHLRALEGELSRTIGSLQRIEAARVHLAIPERRLFERDNEGPRASIVLKLRGDLEAGHVRAIRHLVASAVQGMRPERISIVDENGRLLADGASDGEGLAGGLAADERQTQTERRLQRQVEDIVAGIVGRDRARVQVAAEFDFNRIENRAQTFDPDGRVIRSTQSRNETSVSASRNGEVTVGAELPGAQAGPEGAGDRDESERNEETVNYEISTTTRIETIEGGRLRRLSVAVLVDGRYSQGADGAVVYEPRPQEELEQIATLVRTAIGFDRDRGDQVEVVNLRFADTPAPVEFVEPNFVESLLNPTREDVLRAIEIAVIALLTLVVLLTVVRPLVREILARNEPAAAFVARMTGGAAPTIEAQGPPPESMASKMIEMAKVNGQVQQQSLERVGELVKQSPSETVSVLRQWIHERG
ncbi:MAG: flagellar M-ring protein FliF [Salinarimonadaceae bacterium]|nr:MAG: flagellar M-ring protein FliF [Salinarimonadaceae bacterium]